MDLESAFCFEDFIQLQNLQTDFFLFKNPPDSIRVGIGNKNLTNILTGQKVNQVTASIQVQLVEKIIN